MKLDMVEDVSVHLERIDAVHDCGLGEQRDVCNCVAIDVESDVDRDLGRIGK
jgi:hypothetical protein